MAGNITNAGKVIGAEYGIQVGENISGIIITNNTSGHIEGKTAITANEGITLENDGVVKGNQGNSIEFLSTGGSSLTNSGTIEGNTNGILVADKTKVNIINTGVIKGSGSAITFSSDKKNTLTLNTNSQLVGDVISTVSSSNTLTLLGNGSEDSNFIGLNDGDGFASLTMSGTAWDLTGNVDIIGTDDSLKVDTGKLTLAGTVNNAGNTLISDGATLQLGNGEKTGALSGTLTNNGTLVFNQAADSTFATAITGTGSVTKTDANILTLTGNNSYTGNTLLSSGTTLVAEGATLGTQGNTATLTVDNGATFASAGTVNTNVDILSGGVLASWNAVQGTASSSASTLNTINGNVTNSGMLQIGGLNDSVGNDFTINGDYTGTSGSLISMNSVVADDNSATDHLTITGSSAGGSGINITNIGGAGAQTVNGMQVVSVGGTSAAAFSLSSPVVVGAWEYSLNQHSDGNWYLESVDTTPIPDVIPDDDSGTDGNVTPDDGGSDDSGTDGNVTPDDGGSDDSGTDTNGNDDGGYTPPAPNNLAPEVGAYLGNYLAAQDMFLHKRDDRDQLTLRDEDDLNTWMYVKGRYHENDVAGGKVSYDTTQYVMQVGSDFISKKMDTGVLHSGMMFGAGQAKTDSTSTGSNRSAQGKVDGVNVGVYATWQEDQQLRKGSYIDSWASFGWYHNTLRSDDRSDESYNSKGFAASLEAGHAWVVDSESERTWKIEPQIQAVYSYLDQENHTDADGVRISTPDNDTLLGRAGVKTSYFNQKDVQAWQPYVAVNWLKGAGQNDIAFNGEKFSNDTPDDRGQLELGITGKLNPTTMISLRASGEWGENSYDAYGGHILLNHRW
ncbi:autotransporter outer membrane beta-barrel domain-containing protein [Silvania hatchlandensis]|uniref:Autotransporter outer membrane beta-barrel domain-containing protein n=1 Tax=Silvania hatchlandensis TaxID=2926469 RepID=A0A9J6PX01_9ENTR|nr:autotransporter outer membrane beta-barrel domain-containing protein [Silvania hatchlandensis]MCU6664847.1 autotransporter outer membrane beta-barrel domain-containing protein [Silvania hatchlandensis]